jgi:hypothetical protein
MASVHVYVRAQVSGEAVDKIKTLAESLNKAIAEAGGNAGSVSVVDDPPADETVTTPAVANAREEGRGLSRK